MSNRTNWFVALTAGLLTACSNGDRDITGADSIARPGPTSPRVVMRADGPTDVDRPSGEVVSDFPRVRVVATLSGAGLPGVTVTFRVRSTGETRTSDTDAQGVARFGDFVFGPVAGTETITASAPSLNALTFGGTTRGTIIERYELADVGGQPLPITYYYGTQSRPLVAGRYLLMQDSTFYLIYFYNAISDSLPVRPTGRYARNGNTIDFYQAVLGDRHFSRGTVIGSTMTVDPDDVVNFEREVYVRR